MVHAQWARDKPDDESLTTGELAWMRRFLLAGNEDGIYYPESWQDLRARDARTVRDLARSRATELVREIVDVSRAGGAPRQEPALFALAAACSLGDEDGRRAALEALPVVARTGTHLFLFAGYVERFRGWGRGLRRAVAHWYLDKPVDEVELQAVTHREHQGWSHRDLLRLAHPRTEEDTRDRLFRWILGRDTTTDGLRIVEGYQRALAAPASEVAELVMDYGLSWEMVPRRHLDEPVVWEALLKRGLPSTVLMRQLPRLTRLGLLSRRSAHTAAVVAQLADPERVHPLDVLVAQRTYASGVQEPSRPIVKALDAGFEAAIGTVEPTGRRLLLALDAFDTMIPGMPLSCVEAAAALALVTAATEPRCEIAGLTTTSALTPPSIRPRRRLDKAIRAVSNLPRSKEISAPIQHALDEGREVDAFVVYTDDFWTTDAHHQLWKYREKTGIDAKLIVVAMKASGFQYSPWAYPDVLYVAGFDSAVPNLVSEFARGR